MHGAGRYGEHDPVISFGGHTTMRLAHVSLVDIGLFELTRPQKRSYSHFFISTDLFLDLC